MGALATDAAWATRGLGLSSKLVLLALAREHDDGAQACWPSRERLTELTGVAERTVHDALRELEDLGLIRRFPRMDPATGVRRDDGIILMVVGDYAEKIAKQRGFGGPSRETAHSRSQDGPQTRSRAAPRRSPPPVATSQIPQTPKRDDLARAGELASSDSSLEIDVSLARQQRASTPERARAARRIWEATPPAIQARCRKGLGAIINAMAQLASGDEGAPDDAEIAAGVERFYAANPDSDRLPSYLVLDGDWKAAAPQPRSAAEQAIWEKWDGAKWGHPGHHPGGTYQDPGPMLQWGWLEKWVTEDQEFRDLYWPRPAQGAPPGHPGSRIWPELLDDFRRLNPNRFRDA